MKKYNPFDNGLPAHGHDFFFSIVQSQKSPFLEKKTE
jgi:hypothetical protein